MSFIRMIQFLRLDYEVIHCQIRQDVVRSRVKDEVNYKMIGLMQILETNNESVFSRFCISKLGNMFYYLLAFGISR